MLNAIKKARLLAGYSQEQLAEKVGVSAGAVSQWETGRVHPNVKRLKLIAGVLETTVDNLLEEERAI